MLHSPTRLITTTSTTTTIAVSSMQLSVCLAVALTGLSTTLARHEAQVNSVEAPSVSPIATTPMTNAMGGWSQATVGQNETALLTTALATDALYGSGIRTRLCYVAIESLKQQVVSGMNYEFTVSACPVDRAEDGKCANSVLASCTPAQYKVMVYEQVWTNTTKIMSIHNLSNDTQGSASGRGSSSAPDAGSSGDEGQDGDDGDVTRPTSTLPSPAPTQSMASPRVAASLATIVAAALAVTMM